VGLSTIPNAAVREKVGWLVDDHLSDLVDVIRKCRLQTEWQLRTRPVLTSPSEAFRNIGEMAILDIALDDPGWKYESGTTAVRDDHDIVRLPSLAPPSYLCESLNALPGDILQHEVLADSRPIPTP
jgi:hypothetical protein